MNTFLSFTVNKELFAINVTKVLEVLQKQPITQVPNAPESIKGIINFRGEIIPVFETRVKFNFPPREEGDTYVIIVLDLTQESQQLRAGAIVDRVRDVIEIDPSEIKPVPPMSKDFNPEFIHGIFKSGDNFIMLLSVEKLFNAQEYIESNIVEVNNI